MQMIAAEKLKDYDESKFFPGYASIKRNGIHAIYDPQYSMFYSRTPRVLIGLDLLINELNQCTFNFPLVGELIVPGVDFETCSGRIRDHKLKPEVTFNVFNCIIPNMPFIEKYEKLDSSGIFTKAENVFLEPMHFMASPSSFDSFFDFTVSSGEEGACLIHPDHVYQPGKRTWEWMKRVPLKTMEVEILSINPGTTDKKYESSMGYMTCGFKDKSGKEKQVDVGIFKDQTDSWRQQIYDTREQYYGQKITIEFKALSKYGIPTQPRFKSFRWDL